GAVRRSIEWILLDVGEEEMEEPAGAGWQHARPDGRWQCWQGPPTSLLALNDGLLDDVAVGVEFRRGRGRRTVGVRLHVGDSVLDDLALAIKIKDRGGGRAVCVLFHGFLRGDHDVALAVEITDRGDGRAV